MNELTVQLREITGKESAAKVRREGGIPAVLYGAGGPSRPISVNDAAFRKMLIASGSHLSLLALNITKGNGGGGEPAAEKEHAIIKAIQRHPVMENIIHIDFMRVSLEEKLTAEVPVELEGSAPGVKLGGVLQQAVRQVTVNCLPSLIPRAAIADVSAMEIGNVMIARDLKLPESVELLTDPEQTILSIAVVRVEEEETAAAETPEVVAPEGAEAVQPEVIGEKEREERRTKKEENKETRGKEKQELREQRAKDEK